MNKGRDFFSRKNSANDFIPTPYSMTEQLLNHEDFNHNGTVLEPACGKNKAIYKILVNYFKDENILFYDKYCNQNFFGDDFLLHNENSIIQTYFNYIITNPPFSQWDKFINKARQVAYEKIAILGRLEFLTGLDRFNNNFFYPGSYNLKKVWVLVRKVNIEFNNAEKRKNKKYLIEYEQLRNDGKYPTGNFHYAWFIFQNKYSGKAEIGFINNDFYIIRKKDLRKSNELY